MTSSKSVTASFETLRDADGHLADSTSDVDMKDELSRRAFHAGTVAERCRERFGEGEVPDGAHAVQDADHATALARSASPTSRRDMERANAAAQRANETLNRIVEGHRSSSFSTEAKVDVPLTDFEDAVSADDADAATRQAGPSPVVIALAVAVAVAVVALPLILLRRGAKSKRKRRRD